MDELKCITESEKGNAPVSSGKKGKVSIVLNDDWQNNADYIIADNYSGFGDNYHKLEKCAITVIHNHEKIVFDSFEDFWNQLKKINTTDESLKTATKRRKALV